MMSLLIMTLGIPAIIAYALVLAIICGLAAWVLDLVSRVIDYVIKKWREAKRH